MRLDMLLILMTINFSVLGLKPIKDMKQIYPALFEVVHQLKSWESANDVIQRIFPRAGFGPQLEEAGALPIRAEALTQPMIPPTQRVGFRFVPNEFWVYVWDLRPDIPEGEVMSVGPIRFSTEDPNVEIKTEWYPDTRNEESQRLHTRYSRLPRYMANAYPETYRPTGRPEVPAVTTHIRKSKSQCVDVKTAYFVPNVQKVKRLTVVEGTIAVANDGMINDFEESNEHHPHERPRAQRIEVSVNDGGVKRVLASATDIEVFNFQVARSNLVNLFAALLICILAGDHDLVAKVYKPLSR